MTAPILRAMFIRSWWAIIAAIINVTVPGGGLLWATVR